MKKAMIVLAVAFVFTACNNSTKSTSTTNDSTAVNVDSTKVDTATAK